MADTIHKILIVDDDAEFAEHLAALMPSRYHVKTAYTAKKAMAQLTTYPFDSIVSDFVLAEFDGFDFLKSIRSLTDPPKVVFMTAFANKDMAISLLNSGVQGLLEKPFSVSELTALLDKKTAVNVKPIWRLNPSTRIVSTITEDVELTEVEFKVISYFLGHLGKWISREEMVRHVWGAASHSRNVLDTHLTNLKRKIPAMRGALKTVRGRGYLLEEIPYE